MSAKNDWRAIFMGLYLNPGNVEFAEMLNDRYVDKTGMLALINASINTPRRLTCVSRPRRFGKSYAAKMLCAYYDRSCDSSSLFAGMTIADRSTYREHLNRYNVIYVDMTYLRAYTDNYRDLPSYLSQKITQELKEAYPEIRVSNELAATMESAVLVSGTKFVMIIDEWDAPIRETPENEALYLQFLRMLFKSSGTTAKIFAAAYMTGILPIKKDGSESAISDFEEYSMLSPSVFAPYAGFTEQEVRDLCVDLSGIGEKAGNGETRGRDVFARRDVFAQMKEWYDGYELEGTGPVYNPNSVMKALRRRRFDTYWTQSSAADSLLRFINMDFQGLARTIAELIGGIEVKVNPLGFANDLTSFRDRDDVLTSLIHLGYLTYNEEKGTARIPNEEIRLEFARVIRKSDHTETLRRIAESDRLLEDVIRGREDEVARQIEKIHAEETAPLFYNNEQSLRSVIKLAFYTYKDHYVQMEELPAGTGYADIVYLPKKDSGYPALVIELKWMESAQGVIDQILQKNYPDSLRDFGSEILLVGISYDRNAVTEKRKHTCLIRRLCAGT